MKNEIPSLIEQKINEIAEEKPEEKQEQQKVFQPATSEEIIKTLTRAEERRQKVMKIINQATGGGRNQE